MKKKQNQSTATIKLLDLIKNQVSTKRAKTGVKMLKKEGRMDFVLSIPGLIKTLFDRKEIQIVDNTLNILLHNPLKYEVMDHLAYYSVLPFILENLDLKVHVVSVNRSQCTDSPTLYRKVFDYLNVNELGGRVRTDMYEGSLEEVLSEYGEQYFNVVLNNQSQAEDFAFDKEGITRCVDANVPYFLVDIAPNFLLHRYNMARAIGIESTKSLSRSEHGVRFTKTSSQPYFYGAHFLMLDVVQDFPVEHLDLKELNAQDVLMVSRLDQGDPLTEPVFVKTGNKLSILPLVDADLENNELELHHRGQDYRLTYEELPALSPPVAEGLTQSVDERADSLFSALTVYAHHLHKLPDLRQVGSK